MPRYGSVTALDVFVIALVALACLSGYRRGLVLQLLGYGGLAAGLVGGVRLAPAVAALASGPAAQAGLALATIIVSAALGNALGLLLGSRVQSKASQSPLRAADALAGAGLSGVASLLVVWFLALNLVAGPSPTLGREIRGSLVVRALGDVLPRPPSLVGEARRFLNALGFTDVFAGFPPQPVGPVKLPQQIRAEVAAARASTVEVIGRACNEIQEGSGFVVAPGYVVTNAHVVAGEQATAIQAPERLGAVVVAFDPDLDVAVLHVDGVGAPALRIETEPLARRTAGAVLGYPGGGPFNAEPAAVRRSLAAVGRNIYGTGVVDRRVYELQAAVRPGNSGGPFVLADGRVGGVVFAASTVDTNVGYAIASREAEPFVHAAIGRTSPVSTGGCAR